MLNRDNFDLCLSGLRQDYVSTPATTSHKRNPESQVMLPSYFKKADVDDFTPGNTTESSFSSCWQPRLSSPCKSPAPLAKQSCQSPKLARLHQQVTQFKLLKLAQNQGTQSTLFFYIICVFGLTSVDILYFILIHIPPVLSYATFYYYSFLCGGLMRSQSGYQHADETLRF